MCQSPNSSLVRRTIDLNYANKQRSASLKWLLVNGALLAVLAFDLWRWCGGWECATAWVEALCACVLAANCVQHAARLSPTPRRYPAPLPSAADTCPLTLSPRQQLLLGLKDSDLDSSFLVKERATPVSARAQTCSARSDSPGSLSPPRSWRVTDSPPSPRAGAGAGAGAGGGGSPPHALSGRASPDEFISDSKTLAAYIRRQSGRGGEAGAGAGAGGGRALPSPPRAHQLALLPERGTETSGEEEGAGGGGGGGGGAGAGAGAGGAPLWRRLHVDPQRLTEYNLNLRLWLHVTVVGRVARELAAAEAAGVSLAALGAGAGGAGGARADALLPFLRPFADRQYVADRIKELSAGGCLSAYRWDGGGRGWDARRPTDAELLLHLLAAYLDLLAPPPGFSARHLSAAASPPAPLPAPAPLRLVLHRAARDPPHYVLLLPDETIELPRGRNNLLHTLLLFIAAAARGAPPALCRLHLGPAGLNMLWILGR